jgi:hypothetical protein
MKTVFATPTYWSWLFCVAFFGCGDNELAEVNFIRSDPPTGSRVNAGLTRVDLIFDGTPRSATVNGMMARMENTTVIWEIQDWLDEGEIKLAVEWLNPDESEGKGVVIHYESIHAVIDAPLIADSTVYPGDKDVDPNHINRSGITFQFTKDARSGTIKIRPEGRKPLNWDATWGRDFVIIRPRGDGDKLLPGNNYVIEITGVKSDVTRIREEAVEILDFELIFSTQE